MNDIDYLIEYEPESTWLDFKAIQYKKEKFYELLKDIIAMANANFDGDKFIIMGVDKKPNGSFTVCPIPQSEFVDSAIYQQLILENVEPEIHIEYVDHRYKGSDLIGVLKISFSTDKPYMMKKQYGSDKAIRKPGESFIRKGTTTPPLMRKDIDQILERRIRQDAFSHQVSFYFSGTEKSKELKISPIKIEKFPSTIQAEEIQAIISKKQKQEKQMEEQEKKFPFLSIPKFDPSRFTSFHLGPTSYEERTIETLRENLKVVRETYKEDDDYELFEKYSSKINITILNEGTKYLEDAVIEVEIPLTRGFEIADKIYIEPEEVVSFPQARISFPDYESLNYPQFKQVKGNYIYSHKLGDLKHLQPEEVFEVLPRIVILPLLAGKEVEIKLTLYGKNLPLPIKETLRLKISE